MLTASECLERTVTGAGVGVGMAQTSSTARTVQCAYLSLRSSISKVISPIFFRCGIQTRTCLPCPTWALSLVKGFPRGALAVVHLRVVPRVVTIPKRCGTSWGQAQHAPKFVLTHSSFSGTSLATSTARTMLWLQREISSRFDPKATHENCIVVLRGTSSGASESLR